MKVGDMVREAWESGNAAALGRIVEWLRFAHGLNYQETLDFFRHCLDEDISEARWDEMMYRADRLAAGGDTL